MFLGSQGNSLEKTTLPFLSAEILKSLAPRSKPMRQPSATVFTCWSFSENSGIFLCGTTTASTGRP